MTAQPDHAPRGREEQQTAHVLERTNEMGVPFIGKCLLCGTEGLTMRQANERCLGPVRMSRVDALILAIEGDE